MQSKFRIVHYLVILLAYIYVPTLSATENVTDGITITLKPGSPSFALNNAKETVYFMADVQNQTDALRVIVHPSICFPKSHDGETPYPEEKKIDKSEILLLIQQPSGNQLKLRLANHKRFEPGHLDHLLLFPGKIQAIYIGGFANHPQQNWKCDDCMKDLFSQPGKYEASLIYRNHFSQASIKSSPLVPGKFITPWMGEIQSAPVVFEIQ